MALKQTVLKFLDTRPQWIAAVFKGTLTEGDTAAFPIFKKKTKKHFIARCLLIALYYLLKLVVYL